MTVSANSSRLTACRWRPAVARSGPRASNDLLSVLATLGQAPHPMFTPRRLRHALGEDAPSNAGPLWYGPATLRAPSTSSALSSSLPSARSSRWPTPSAWPRPVSPHAPGTATPQSTASGPAPQCPPFGLAPHRERTAPGTSGSTGSGVGTAASTPPSRSRPRGCAGCPPC